MVRSLSRRAFTAAAVLSAVAGFVDGVGFVSLGGFFVSFMSGNTTRASVGLAGGDLGMAAVGLILILAFVAGVIAGTAMPSTSRGRGETRILILVTIFVAVAAGALMIDWPLLSGAAMALSMGAMNTVFARGGEVAFGLTYMTGALVKVGQGIVTALRGGSRTDWVRHAVLWLAIGTGAAAGALAFVAFGAGALWGLVVAMATALAIPPVRAWVRV